MRRAAAATIPLTDLEPTPADFRSEFLAGLQRRPRLLPCKFFYDERGSRLFDRICELPEYYPTRTEAGILARNLDAIAAFCGRDCLLVELGSGSSRKTRLLLDRLEAPAGYVPIDISRAHLRAAAATLAGEYPALEILPVCADYAQPLRLPAPDTPAERRVVFFPGSTIGNFHPPEAVRFLRRIRDWCEPGDRLIVGVDLEKRREILEPAYNDERGITAAFNLNLLVRANRELGADFVLERFSHEAIYDAERRRIEMRIVSGCEQVVAIGRERFEFGPGERIVTEYSYKYPPSQFAGLASEAGWSVVRRWSDRRDWFGVFALELRSGV